jgi:hypothetical protein
MASRRLEMSGFTVAEESRFLENSMSIRDRCYDFKNIFAEKIGVFDSRQS